MARIKLRLRVDYNQRKHVAQRQIARQRRPVKPLGAGVKNIEGGRVRNRRFKIKRIMDQPKTIELKKKTLEQFVKWLSEDELYIRYGQEKLLLTLKQTLQYLFYILICNCLHRNKMFIL